MNDLNPGIPPFSGLLVLAVVGWLLTK